MKKNEFKKKIVITFSMFILILSMGLYAYKDYDNNAFELKYEYINIKDMALVQVATKTKSSYLLSDLLKIGNTNDKIKGIDLESVNKDSADKVQESAMPVTASAQVTANKEVWHLPTEIGIVTQYPSYGHMAYDITSPRGQAENIFPVASGVVSSMYTDSWGALVVTVLHNVNGKIYTSLYAHLSGYDSSLYVGKPVTINDSLGRMGTTGYSTGVHLHLVVLDCGLFQQGDVYCSDLNGFFRFGKQRFSQGYYGLGSLKYVPGSWNSR